MVPTRTAKPPALPFGQKKQQVVTAILIVAPLLGVVAAALGVISPRVTLLDVILAVSFYAVSGHGLTAGFHRMLTHRSFKAARWVKITLAVSGSLGMEGSVISWVANHRRHHAYTDTKGDPHSPYEYGEGTGNQIPAPCTRTLDGSSKPSRPRKRDGRQIWSEIEILSPLVGSFPCLASFHWVCPCSSDGHSLGRGRGPWAG